MVSVVVPESDGVSGVLFVGPVSPDDGAGVGVGVAGWARGVVARLSWAVIVGTRDVADDRRWFRETTAAQSDVDGISHEMINKQQIAIGNLIARLFVVLNLQVNVVIAFVPVPLVNCCTGNVIEFAQLHRN